MKLILLLVVSLLFAACSNGNSAEAVPTFAKKQTPSEVVRSYVRIASSGRLEDLGSITTELPKSDTKSWPNANSNPDSKAVIAPSEDVANQATLDWIRRDFPKSIREDGFVLKSILNETVEDDEAKVETAIGKPNAGVMGWVFLLRFRDGKWFIYDITTPAGMAYRSQAPL